MWLYRRLQARMSQRTVQLGTMFYYAVILFLTLLFAFEPISGFRYAQF